MTSLVARVASPFSKATNVIGRDRRFIKYVQEIGVKKEDLLPILESNKPNTNSNDGRLIGIVAGLSFILAGCCASKESNKNIDVQTNVMFGNPDIKTPNKQSKIKIEKDKIEVEIQKEIVAKKQKDQIENLLKQYMAVLGSSPAFYGIYELFSRMGLFGGKKVVEPVLNRIMNSAIQGVKGTAATAIPLAIFYSLIAGLKPIIEEGIVKRGEGRGERISEEKASQQAYTLLNGLGAPIEALIELIGCGAKKEVLMTRVGLIGSAFTTILVGLRLTAVFTMMEKGDREATENELMKMIGVTSIAQLGIFFQTDAIKSGQYLMTVIKNKAKKDILKSLTAVVVQRLTFLSLWEGWNKKLKGFDVLNSLGFDPNIIEESKKSEQENSVDIDSFNLEELEKLKKFVLDNANKEDHKEATNQSSKEAEEFIKNDEEEIKALEEELINLLNKDKDEAEAVLKAILGETRSIDNILIKRPAMSSNQAEVVVKNEYMSLDKPPKSATEG